MVGEAGQILEVVGEESYDGLKLLSLKEPLTGIVFLGEFLDVRYFFEEFFTLG